MRKMTAHLEQCDQCKVEQGRVCPGSLQGFVSDYEATSAITTSPKTSMGDTLSAQSKFSVRQSIHKTGTTTPPAIYRATLDLSVVTCDSCVSSITYALKQLSPVHTVNISFLTSSGTVEFEGKDSVEETTSTTEDCGFEARVEKLEEVSAAIV